MTEAPASTERLLLELMAAPDRAAAHHLMRLDNDQWSALIDLAREHRCAAYLAFAASRQPGIVLPEPLRVLRDRSVRRAMRIGRECVAINGILVQAGIPHLFLKGIPLAFRDYPEPWARPMRDIDILVPPGQAAEAYAVLLQAGAPMAAYPDTPAEITEDGKHFAPIHSPNRSMPVEVHYRMILPTVALPQDALRIIEDEAWLLPEVVAVGPSLLPVPATEVLLAHLVIHGMLDHELNNGPLFVTDILQVLRSERVDPARWTRLVDRLGIHRAVSLTASILPAADRMKLAGKLEPDAVLPEETARLLMLQPATRRSQLKLEAALSDAAPPGKAMLLVGKLFPGPATLRRRWMADGRLADRIPPLVVLWLWYIADRAQRHLRRRTERDTRRLAGLRDLRRRLAGPSGRR